jgi:hypothetical protein
LTTPGAERDVMRRSIAVPGRLPQESRVTFERKIAARKVAALRT